MTTPTQQILATLAPDWQLPVVAILAIAQWDTGFGATTGPSMAAASLRPVWQLPVWIRMALHIGTCHSGHSWQLSLGPRGGCHMVIYGYLLLFYFLYKNEMIRWFPCGTWRNSGSFIVMIVWGCTAGFIFFFLSLLSKLLLWNNYFLGGSMWFLLFLAPLC